MFGNSGHDRRAGGVRRGVRCCEAKGSIGVLTSPQDSCTELSVVPRQARSCLPGDMYFIDCQFIHLFTLQITQGSPWLSNTVTRMSQEPSAPALRWPLGHRDASCTDMAPGASCLQVQTGVPILFPRRSEAQAQSRRPGSPGAQGPEAGSQASRPPARPVRMKCWGSSSGRSRPAGPTRLPNRRQAGRRLLDFCTCTQRHVKWLPCIY